MPTGKAFDMLQQCMQHTPTLVELYTLKAKILKHAGDVEGAAAAADKARSMDLADRCLCPSTCMHANMYVVLLFYDHEVLSIQITVFHVTDVQLTQPHGCSTQAVN